MPNARTEHSRRLRQRTARDAELANARAGGWNKRFNLSPSAASKLRAEMARTGKKALHVIEALLDTLEP